MIRCCMSMQLAFQCHFQMKTARKLNVQRLQDAEIQQIFVEHVEENLSDVPEHSSIEEEWSCLRDTMYRTMAIAVGYRNCLHDDWFDENDTEAGGMLDKLIIWTG